MSTSTSQPQINTPAAANHTPDDGGPVSPGISLRDYLAANAYVAHALMDAIVCRGSDMDMENHDSLAREAYQAADSLLKVRQEGSAAR